MVLPSKKGRTAEEQQLHVLIVAAWIAVLAVAVFVLALVVLLGVSFRSG